MKVISKYLSCKFLDIIKASKSIFITGHTRPDGDTIGSALALYSALKKLDKKLIEIVMKENFLDSFRFLPNSEEIKIMSFVDKKYDLGIILECSDTTRMDNIINLNNLNCVVNIDHHKNYRRSYGSSGLWLDIIYAEYSSCSEIIYDIFKHWGIKIDKSIAKCLYVGLLTDTGKFQWSNTNKHSFDVAGELIELGVKTLEIYKEIYGNKSYKSMILLGKALRTLKVISVGCHKIGYMKITYKDFLTTKATPNDAEDFINFPVSISSVDIALFFREDRPGIVRVSLRSEKINVERIARHFKGGGHTFASGVTMAGNIDDVIKQIINFIRQILVH